MTVLLGVRHIRDCCGGGWMFARVSSIKVFTLLCFDGRWICKCHFPFAVSIALAAPVDILPSPLFWMILIEPLWRDDRLSNGQGSAMSR